MLPMELPVVDQLLERQRHHPPLDGFPMAARIGDLPLFLGEAGAAQDAIFLESNTIRGVIALGTGNLTLVMNLMKPCEVLLIDILDMEEELLLSHFKDCIEFLQKHLIRVGTPTAVLVHCAYGQSRSAAVCVAFLMATQGKTLLEAYDQVQLSRPCISINPGFLRQLELFERMEFDSNVMGSTSAHAEFRTLMARQDRMKKRKAAIANIPQLALPGTSMSCRKCNFALCTARNQLMHSPASGELCSGIFIEPMEWMTNSSEFIQDNVGKLYCPSCKAKLGSWNWIGVKCNCKYFVSPAFQLVPSKTQSRVL
ncbi:uncharacterized protein CCR75_005710 [Bremia lactucae]|uniref:protein-tyrosine-phosphatase n=1 Tax=Bremia lactucae TaxID=4779 RepID=A0A976FIA1_BRELC|nr:hypothetical protein CCR75_008313 [Bremia lactucae]TDH71968.1 hypothetical protein CCR75_005710 [Bremia lactucae]